MDVKISTFFKSYNKSLFICQEIHRSHSPGIFYRKNPLNFSFTLLLFELILVICSTRIIRFLLKPLKQPRFISDILGGILVGPTMLGRNQSFTNHIFPTDAWYVTQNIGIIGFIYYLFVAGVKMDLTLVRKATRKQLSMAFFGFLIPFLVGLVISLPIRKSMYEELARPQILCVVLCVLAISSFPVIEQIVAELNLLSSEVGRLALAIVIVTDVVGMNCIVIFEAARQYDYMPIHALWAILSAIVLVCLVFAFRYALLWIMNATPEGKPVHDAYVVMILGVTLVASFYTDVTGLNLALGPFWLGLVVPTGPPLGATLVDRVETITNEFLMPFGFVLMGMMTDLTSMRGNWDVVWPLFVMTVTVAAAKFVIVFLLGRFYELPVKDSLTLSLILGMRGQLELLLYLNWVTTKVIPTPSFSMLVLLTIIVTAISTPVVRILYDPTRPYMVNKRRAIQFTAPGKELRIVACIHDQHSVTGFINLLEVSHPTASSPFTIFALRLIELVGRAHPVFVDHENQVEAFELTGYNRIHNVLTTFQELMGEYVKCHFFTSVSPTRTMYQDICKLALMKKAAIIILPFRTESSDGRTEVVQGGVLHSMITNVLSHAPCSVGILVDRMGPFRNHHLNHSMRDAGHHFAVLFLGGADAREALTYADCMASNPNVSLTVVRFLSSNGVGDDLMEKKLDDGLVTWFWVKNEENERVVYRESVVSDGSGTVLTIQAMMSDCYYDLWIVGRKNGINQVLVEGLSSWSKNDELGVIGDYIASVELAMNASVLVVQQQVLRGQEGNSGGLLGKLLGKL